MKRCFILLLLLVAGPIFAQQSTQTTVPEIHYRSVPDFLKLPQDIYFGEVSGVAVEFEGARVCFLARQYDGPRVRRGAAQLLEFGADGKFLREIGHNLYAWSYAHTVKIDSQDNIWVTDKGSDMIVKFNPEGRVVMVFGRKQEASDEGTGPLKHVRPPLPPVDGMFRQVTDVAWDARREHIYQRRLCQFARRQSGRGRQLASVVGRAWQRAGTVQHAAQHRC